MAPIWMLCKEGEVELLRQELEQEMEFRKDLNYPDWNGWTGKIWFDRRSKQNWYFETYYFAGLIWCTKKQHMSMVGLLLKEPLVQVFIVKNITHFRSPTVLGEPQDKIWLDSTAPLRSGAQHGGFEVAAKAGGLGHQRTGQRWWHCRHVCNGGKANVAGNCLRSAFQLWHKKQSWQKLDWRGQVPGTQVRSKQYLSKTK